MKTPKQHWTVITHKEWPAIIADGQDAPFVIFGSDTVLGERAARRWAELITAWMNEQMRTGVSGKLPRHVAQLRTQLRKANTELRKLALENQDIHSKLMKARVANQRAFE